MSDEVKKAQEEAQKMAQQLGIYEIVRNVACQGVNNHHKNLTAEWSGCKIVFEQIGAITKSDGETSITMANGTILYRALEEGKKVTHFRYGSWVEKLAQYSDEIIIKKRRAEAEKEEQEKKAKLAPFAAISDEEFEKMVRYSEY